MLEQIYSTFLEHGLNTQDIKAIVESCFEKEGTVLLVLNISAFGDKGPNIEKALLGVEKLVGKNNLQVVRTDHKLTKKTLPGVKHVIAIASGKGGVGKSTTAVNLAYALLSQGLKVGLLDADVYGPSIPTLLGFSDQITIDENKRIKPFVRDGLKVMSLGFMLQSDSAVIWRGLMVQSAIKQLIKDVLWDDEGALDVLVVDLPPGTGDVQLTLVQTLDLAGAVIVSTPQDLALIDAKRAHIMFEKVGVPIIGLIENMSHLNCPHCTESIEVFGASKVKPYAIDKALPFLGQIPLDLRLRESSDSGKPLVLHESESDSSKRYIDISQKIKEFLYVL